MRANILGSGLFGPGTVSIPRHFGGHVYSRTGILRSYIEFPTSAGARKAQRLGAYTERKIPVYSDADRDIGTRGYCFF